MSYHSYLYFTLQCLINVPGGRGTMAPITDSMQHNDSVLYTLEDCCSTELIKHCHTAPVTA